MWGKIGQAAAGRAEDDHDDEQTSNREMNGNWMKACASRAKAGGAHLQPPGNLLAARSHNDHNHARSLSLVPLRAGHLHRLELHSQASPQARNIRHLGARSSN